MRCNLIRLAMIWSGPVSFDHLITSDVMLSYKIWSDSMDLFWWFQFWSDYIWSDLIIYSIDQSINQSTNQSMIQSINDSINPWFNQSINQWFNHSLTQSCNQSNELWYAWSDWVLDDKMRCNQICFDVIRLDVIQSFQVWFHQIRCDFIRFGDVQCDDIMPNLNSEMAHLCLCFSYRFSPLCWASGGGATNSPSHVFYMGVSYSH